MGLKYRWKGVRCDKQTGIQTDKNKLLVFGQTKRQTDMFRQIKRQTNSWTDKVEKSWYTLLEKISVLPNV